MKNTYNRTLLSFSNYRHIQVVTIFPRNSQVVNVSWPLPLIDLFLQLLDFSTFVVHSETPETDLNYIGLEFLTKGESTRIVSFVYRAWWIIPCLCSGSVSLKMATKYLPFDEYARIYYAVKVGWNKVSYVDFIQFCSIRAIYIMRMDCITQMRVFPRIFSPRWSFFPDASKSR